MTVSVLHGGLPGKITAATPLDDFIGEFIDRITVPEWRVLAMMPTIPNVLVLVNTVVEMRRQQVIAKAHVPAFWRAAS